MTRELLKRIEETRYQMHTTSFREKEKLLSESRKLDLLIIKYYRLNDAGLQTDVPNPSYRRL